MEFALSVLASIVAVALLAVIGVLWRKVRGAARELSIMNLSAGTVPDVSGDWRVTFEQTQNMQKSMAHADVFLRQHGGALLGTMVVPDPDNIRYRFRGVFTGDAVTGYFWTDADRGDVGTFFLRCSADAQRLRGSYTGVSWDRTFVTGQMKWDRNTEGPTTPPTVFSSRADAG